MADFLTGLFEDADPIGRHGRTFGARPGVGPNLLAREIIDRGAARLKESVNADPATRALLLDKIGTVYLSLGLFNEADPLVRESLDLRQEALGADHSKVADSLQTLGMLHVYRQEFDKAEDAMQRALDIRVREHGEDHPLVSDILLDLGVVMLVEDNVSEARDLMQRSLEIRRKAYGPESSQALACLIFLSVVETTGGVDFSQSIEAARVWKATRGSDEFGEFIGFAVNAMLAIKIGGSDAYDEIRKAEKKGIELLGEDHVFLNLFRMKFANYLKKAGRFDEAREICRQGIASIRKTLGDDSIYLTQMQGSLGDVEYAADRQEAAATGYREANRVYQAYAEKHGPEKYARLQAECLQKLGRSLNILKKFDDAGQAFHKSIVLRQKHRVGEFAIAPSGLVVALLSTEREPVSQPAISRNAARGKPRKAISIAGIWIRAARMLETKNPNLSDDDRIVIESLRLGAIAILDQAVRNGFRNSQKVLADPDLKTLSDHKAFPKLLKRMDRK